MTALDLINKTVKEHPLGEELLNIVKVNLDGVNVQYHDCELFRSIVKLKFDLDHLNTNGYSIKEILDVVDGSVVNSEVHLFCLHKLQSYVNTELKIKNDNNGLKNDE